MKQRILFPNFKAFLIQSFIFEKSPKMSESYDQRNLLPEILKINGKNPTKLSKRVKNLFQKSV